MKCSSLNTVFLAVVLSQLGLFAGDSEQLFIDDKSPLVNHAICDFLDRGTLYENEERQFFQEFTFTGRLNVDAAFFESNSGDYDSLEWRRARVGFRSRHFDHFTLNAETSLDLNDRDPVYDRLTNAYIAWSKSDELEVRLGKHSAGFTLDGATSSKRLLRVDRGILATNLWFPGEYFTGASAKGKVDSWFYQVGIFSSDGGKEFGDFEAGQFGLISIGYDFAEAWGLDKAFLRGDYVHNEISSRGVLNTRSLDNVGSINLTLEQGRVGLLTDVSAGTGLGTQSDLFAVAITPYYNLSDQWQLVASYNYVMSDAANGVRLGRYESRIESGRANEAHEFYFGVNRYFCGHKLKWQNGVEYMTSADSARDGGSYDGWGLVSGIRISW